MKYILIFQVIFLLLFSTAASSEQYTRSRWDAFFAVWQQLDSNRLIINNWPVNETNDPLLSAYNTVTYGQIVDKTMGNSYYNTVVIKLLHDNSLLTQNTSPVIEPIGSYPKGNTSYELTSKICEEYDKYYQKDPVMYNSVIECKNKYQKLFEDSVYATGYTFFITDPDGIVKDVFGQDESNQLYDIVKIEDNVYELSVPVDDKVSSLTITAIDNDATCIVYNDESKKCEEYSRYDGGYSFYPFLTDTE